MAQAHLRPHGTEGSTAYRASPQDVTASSYTSFQIQGITWAFLTVTVL